MRCPDCNKFVSNEEMEPEVNDIEMDEEGNVTCEVRICNACADCGTELSEYTFDLETQVDLSGHKTERAEDQPDHEYTIEEDSSERVNRVEGKGRGARTFYGASVTFRVTCNCDTEHSFECVDTMTDFVQASSMDSLI